MTTSLVVRIRKDLTIPTVIRSRCSWQRIKLLKGGRAERDPDLGILPERVMREMNSVVGKRYAPLPPERLAAL